MQMKQILSPKKKSILKKISLAMLLLVGVIVLGSSTYGYKVYKDVKKTTDKIYNKVETEQVRGMPAILTDGDPISILLLGIDTGDKGRIGQGRSDSIIFVTINPKNKTTKMISIPRDTYVDIPGFGMDKINHAYAFGGVELSINTIQKVFDVPIDYYVEVDMKGIKELVDVLDGVDIDNHLVFNYEGTHFPLGPQHLNGTLALKYVRMRYEDPVGDYGRQKRQRQVVEAIIKTGATLSTLVKYQDVLNTLETNLKTNLSFEDIYDMQTKYKEVATNIEQIQLQGAGEMIDGISYQIVTKDELARVTKTLKTELYGEE